MKIEELEVMKAWQDEIAKKPFTLKEAAEYLGVASVTLRRWVKAGRVSASKIGRAYTFDVRDLKKLKQTHTSNVRRPTSDLRVFAYLNVHLFIAFRYTSTVCSAIFSQLYFSAI